MKSAYEAALERLDEQGIERPRDNGIEPEIRDRIAELRSRTDAKLAQLEILLRDRLRGLHDPAAREQSEAEYVAERRRLEEQRDREIDKLRSRR